VSRARGSSVEGRESRIGGRTSNDHRLSTIDYRLLLPLLLLVTVRLPAALGGAPGAPAATVRDRNLEALRRMEPQPFALMDWGGRLGFETVWRRERQTSDEGNEFERRLRRFEEYIELTGHGFVYHPLFMDWQGRVRLGLLQQSFHSDAGRSESVNDVLREYDFTALFFQEKPVRLRLHASRRDDIVRDLFSDVINYKEDLLGADVLFVNALAPSRVGVQHQAIHRFGFSQDSDSTLDTAEASTHILPGSRFQTDASYLFRDYHEDFRGHDGFSVRRTTDIRSHDLNATNIARFGPDGRQRLTTTGRYYDQTGSISIRQSRFHERLDSQWTPRLDSYLSYAYDRVEAEAQTTRQHRVNAGLHHRLYESLDSFLEGRYRRTQFDTGGDETVYGGGLRFAYRKTTPWGLLSSGYGIDIDQIDRGQGGGNRQVTDESVVLIDGVLTFLSQQDIVLSSAVVTDATGLTIYTRDLDYRLTVIGNRVLIERILGGAIANGQLVLVDYLFFQSQNISFTQISQAFNVRHDWTEGVLDGLSLYYRLGDLRHSGSVGDSELLEFTSNTLGLLYRWRMLEWTEEYQIFDANISPYNSLRSALYAHFSPWRRSQLRAGAEYLKINFRDGSENTDLFNLTTDWNVQVARNMNWDLQALYRVERGINDEDNFGVASYLRWAYRKLSAELGVRYELLDRSGTQRNNAMVYLSVTRAF
jgi:hypothetical protein